MRLVTALVFLSFYTQHGCSESGDDFYKLLGVGRDADLKEIRKAFKLLAVKLHPDKNKDDEGAEAKFIRVARAYEVLKDPETRKNYDLNGDTQSRSGAKHKYHSYTYYRDNFGIYDDDPLIVTLSRADYDVNVLDRTRGWFVNFYSPNCHHCHELAPTWRRLAADLEGVIRLAAVNCEDDWSLCYQLSIQSYPTLIYYEKAATINEGIRYMRSRTFDQLKQFVLDRLTVKPLDSGSDWMKICSGRCLLVACASDAQCLDAEKRVKLSAILDGLLPVVMVTDAVAADELVSAVVFARRANVSDKWEHVAVGEVDDDVRTIVNEVLRLLPNPPTLTAEEFRRIRSVGEEAWLLCFYMGLDTDLDLQLKRLPGLVDDVKVGLVHCGKSADLCAALHINRYPTWAVVKPAGGAFEVHRGRDVIDDLVTFARDSTTSTNLHALTPADFRSLIRGGAGDRWFVDWYAPWCPPCKRLLPEWRRASRHFTSDRMKFGTVDCTQFGKLCAEEGITAYPSTVIYEGAKSQRYHGVLNEAGLVEFVRDYLEPRVIELTTVNFDSLLGNKPKDELWFVDWHAPWCGACQRLSSEWRRLATDLAQDFPSVKIAQVDCTAQSALCDRHNVQSYPTLRLYPLDSAGLSSVAIYTGNRDVASLKRWLLNFLPSSVVSLNAANFRAKLFDGEITKPYLVDFYAPWCHHCTHFEPEYRKVAQRLEGRVITAKVDCEAERHLCASLYINSYPSVVLFFSKDEKYDINTQQSDEVVRIVEEHLAKKEIQHDEL